MPYPTSELDEVVDSAGPLWESLRDSRILITGGTGFFGSWLVETFARANSRLRLGARATVLARHTEALRRKSPQLADDPRLEWCDCDVRSGRLPEGAFSHVIHAATAASAISNQQNLLEMMSVIVDGTRRVLDLALRSQARFVFVSSGAVYGPQPADLPNVAEDHAGAPPLLDPRFAYAEAKRLAELCAACALPAVIARPFAFVGPGLPLDQHFAIGNFIGDGLALRPIRVKGDGTTVRSYLYASDLAGWLWTLLVSGQPRRAYNVGSEEAVSIRELASSIGAHFGVPVQIDKTPVPGAPVDRYVPSTRRAREELGLSQRVPLAEAIRRTAQWHRSEA